MACIGKFFQAKDEMLPARWRYTKIKAHVLMLLNSFLPWTIHQSYNIHIYFQFHSRPILIHTIRSIVEINDIRQEYFVCKFSIWRDWKSYIQSDNWRNNFMTIWDIKLLSAHKHSSLSLSISLIYSEISNRYYPKTLHTKSLTISKPHRLNFNMKGRVLFIMM